MADDLTKVRELEMMRRGLGSSIPISNFDDFSQYLNNQRTREEVSGKRISDAFAPVRRGLAAAFNQPLERFSDLISGVGAAADTGISYGLGGASSALGMDNVGQYFLDSGKNSSNRMKEKFTEMVDPDAPMGMYDSSDLSSGFRPGSDEALLAEFGADPSISGPMPSGVKPGDENKPSRTFPSEVEQFLNKKSGRGAGKYVEKAGDRQISSYLDNIIQKDEETAALNREGSLDMPDQSEATTNALIAALADKNAQAGEPETKADTREELLEKYKQEFADATGLSIDGKPDKSHALMAMGLSLMQNRAGKGFNVGKILNAFGKSGEKALPYLEKARTEATAAKVSAGKYALGQIKAGENATAALAASDLAWQRERKLKEMEYDAEDSKNDYKAGEVKNPYFDEPMDGVKIRKGRSREGAKYMDPAAALQTVAATSRKINGALATLDKMDTLVNDIKIGSDGPAVKIVADRFKSLLVGGGLLDADVAFPEGGISTEQQLKAFQDSIVNEFKRFLTQETGNGISNVDIENLKLMTGKIDLFKNPAGAALRLKEIRGVFMSKRNSVKALRENIMNPKFYATNQEFLDNQENFDTLLSGTTTYRFLDTDGTVINVEDKD
tara:strand:+ start:189 stop:2030 length:1842 start_codon:yes stop_codon:yes gene_type:complete